MAARIKNILFSKEAKVVTVFLIGAKLTVDVVFAAKNDVHSDVGKKIGLKQQKIVIVGGGSAGIGVAAQLANEGATDITIVEPSDVHYYQPLWTLVGGGILPVTDSVRPTSSVIPKNSKWIQQSAKGFDPANNSISLADGSQLNYDYLVVASGMQCDWKSIPGLNEALVDEKSSVVSIYNYKYADKTWNVIKQYSGGRAIFTVPTTPVKCPGAVQKIMWLFEEYVRDQGIRAKASVEFWIPGEAMFGVKKYAELLEIQRVQRDVKVNFKKNLIAVDGVKKIATFKSLVDGSVSEESFELLHVTPPMSGCDVYKSSSLANENGYILVDQYSLQSTKFPNVFALGDCTNTPNSKTVAAVTSQAPVLVHNLSQHSKGEELNGVYTGYASCPLVIGKDKVILAEFGYGGKLMETFDSKTGRFPLSLIGQDGPMHEKMWSVFKKTLFPLAYWNLWTKGHWFGTYGPFKPDVTKNQK